MTDDDLDAIEAKANGLYALTDNVIALVAEVRRLRGAQVDSAHTESGDTP